MKAIQKCRSLSRLILIILVTDCKSDDNLFESTTAASVTTVYYGTSSNKFYSAENKLKAVQFARINWPNLTADMANGQGEYLSTLADLMVVKPTQKPAFYRMAKNRFSQLLPSAEVTPEQLVIRLQVAIGKLDKT